MSTQATSSPGPILFERGIDTPPKSIHESFSPFVAAHTRMKELTPKSILIGIFFSVIFGLSSVYLALRTGLTAGSSISIAVVSIGILKHIGKTNILENNMIQTIGSAAESIASGLVFRVTGLIFLAEGIQYFNYFQLLILAILGGMLGVLFMIPLRHSLIVKEHHTLKYPEGTACAEVLIAGEKQGPEVQPVFWGASVGIIYWILMKLFGLWKEIPVLLKTSAAKFYPNATLAITVSPENLGIGYIIGPKTTSQMMLGGALMWLCLIPLFSFFPKLPQIFHHKDVFQTLSDLGNKIPNNPGVPTADQIYQAYGKFIGLGAVVCGGLITLFKSLRILATSIKNAIKSLQEKNPPSQIRTEQDLPLSVVLIGIGFLLVMLTLVPFFPWRFPSSLLIALLIVVFAFFFVTVSSRFVGIVGYSMDPVTSMMFTTVMATCVIFIFLKWTQASYQPIVLLIGSIVCLAAGNAGATSQDLKTGFLLGATPWKQQVGFGIGVICSSVILSGALLLIDHSQTHAHIPHLIGAIVPGEDNARFPAPQGTIIATLIKAVLSGKPPWGLVALGAMLSVIAHLLGLSALSVASGIYFSIHITTSLFIGGLLRLVTMRAEKRAIAKDANAKSKLSKGMLCATGLVAGGSLAGMIIGIFSGFFQEQAKAVAFGHEYWKLIEPFGDYLALLILGLLGFFLLRQAKPK